VYTKITRSYILLTLACALASSANAQFVQQGGKLVAAANGAYQGYSVALSADGNTAIVGAPPHTNGGLYAPVGGAWVYTRSGGVRSQQGGELVGTGAVGSAGLGWSVALSSDGNTAIVGGPGDNLDTGAAWVYTRSGGVWAQQGSKLVGTGAVGGAYQGWSVALSADGNTAIVGGDGDNPNYQGVGAGAAWVYTRSGGVWTQQGSKLVGTGAVGSACQGLSVALSGDGNTAIVGGDEDNNQAGAAWVYTRSGGVWIQQGSKLVGTGSVQGQYGAGQGYSVALSSDGNTAIVGGAFDNADAGAVWVFTRSGGVWTQQGSKLVGTGSVGNAGQGHSVALSGDGNTAIVGASGNSTAAGAVWVYTRSGGVWTQQGGSLAIIGAYGGGAYEGGCSVALSADGNTAIVGGYGDNNNTGAAWVFVAHSTAPVGLTALPASLTFTSQAMGSTPPSQSLIVISTTGTSVPFIYAAVTTTGPSGWLSMSLESAVTPATVVVGVNPTGLGL
jgi:antibiotic biosynthesis monooxygenase (ABM) superfamily enzyme